MSCYPGAWLNENYKKHFEKVSAKKNLINVKKTNKIIQIIRLFVILFYKRRQTIIFSEK